MQLKFNKTSWPKVAFGDLVKKINNKINPDEYHSDIVIEGGHINKRDFHIRSYENKNELGYLGPAFHMGFRKGQILYVSRNPHLMKVGYPQFDGICANTTFILETKNNDVLLNELIPFIMHSDTFVEQSVANVRGGVNPYVNWGDLAKIEIFFPPLNQQKEIIELLSSINKVIESDLNLERKLNQFRLTLMKKFIAGESDWNRFRIKKLMDFNYGKALKETDRKEGLFSVVTSAGIQGTHDEYLVKGPGIVVGRKGNAGEVIWVEKNFWPIDTAYFISIKDEFSHIPLKFFYYLLRAANLKKHLISTAVPGLNRDDALGAHVFFPPENEIKLMLKELEQIDELLMKVASKIIRSKSLQLSLINKIF